MIGLRSIGTMVSGAGGFQPRATCGRTVSYYFGGRSGDLFELRAGLRRGIAFSRRDIRIEAPAAKFDLALWSPRLASSLAVSHCRVSVEEFGFKMGEDTGWRMDYSTRNGRSRLPRGRRLDRPPGQGKAAAVRTSGA